MIIVITFGFLAMVPYAGNLGLNFVILWWDIFVDFHGNFGKAIPHIEELQNR